MLTARAEYLEIIQDLRLGAVVVAPPALAFEVRQLRQTADEVIHKARPRRLELVAARGNTHAEHDIELEVQVSVLVAQAQVDLRRARFGLHRVKL